MPPDRGLLRVRSGHDHHRVSFVELFFDLVFVFAVTQLSHSLIDHFSVLGAVQTLLLMVAVWWVWMYTTWCTNWLDPEKVPVRLLMMAMMLAGILLSASIPKAFETRGVAFAFAYVSMQLGRTGFFLWAVRGHARLVQNFQRIFVWLAVSAVLWIAGGFAAESSRLALWALAIGLEFLAPWVGFHVPVLGRSTTADWDVEGGHMAERCGLFIIIALGESILVTGATFSALKWDPPLIAAFVASFVGSLAMWWLYFGVEAETGSRTISASDDPGRLARLAYTYVHLLLVAGIIVAAVGDEFVLTHPTGHAGPGTAIVVLGSTALYLLGHTLFAWAITGRARPSSLGGLVAIGALVPFASHLSPLALMTASTVVLVSVVLIESIPTAKV
jgi:low temperature requirement protein LtrA